MLWTAVDDSQSMRSGANHLLVRHSHLKNGHRTFSLVAPHVWNALLTSPPQWPHHTLNKWCVVLLLLHVLYFTISLS